uniref:Putative secreted protein n=1 Tax=Panstrongylus lignarius TaxID=156445 RepID=A0A224XTS3_9HEMI
MRLTIRLMMIYVLTSAANMTANVVVLCTIYQMKMPYNLGNQLLYMMKISSQSGLDQLVGKEDIHLLQAILHGELLTMSMTFLYRKFTFVVVKLTHSLLKEETIQPIKQDIIHYI